MRSRRSSSVLARAGIVGLAVVASSGLSLTPASAAEPAVVTLDPASVRLELFPHHHGFNADAIPNGSPAPSYDFANYGGSLTVTLTPHVVLDPAGYVKLELTSALGTPATRFYASADPDPAVHLDVTDLGGGTYRVDLPADDGVNGDIGILSFNSLHAADPSTGFVVAGRFETYLAFTSAPAPALDLTVQTLATDRCYIDAACGSTSVAAGSALTVALPASGRLAALGVTDLSRSTVRLENDASGQVIELSGPLAADGRGVAVTLPTGIRGAWRIVVEALDGTGAVLTTTAVDLDVTAVNRGLSSHTDWNDHRAADEGVSPLVPVGAGLLVVAAGTAAGVLRSRRGGATQD
ncbi:hypothetical protein ACI8AF_03335 [Blastococcus sp. SYSU D00669]